MGEGKAEIIDNKVAAATPVFVAYEQGLDVARRIPTKNGKYNTVRTVLAKETRMDVDARVRKATEPIIQSSPSEGSISFASYNFSARRWMPQRPRWDYHLSAGRQHYREVKQFKRWRNKVRRDCSQHIEYAVVFEENLQVWRQLWRVLERSDVIVLIVDVRHPLFHLPPALYAQVRWVFMKPLVVVLNKLDTVSAQHAEAWAEAIRVSLPGVSDVVGFAQDSLHVEHLNKLAFGKKALLEACHRSAEKHRATEMNNSEKHGLPNHLRPGSNVFVKGLTGKMETHKGELAVIVKYCPESARWRVRWEDMTYSDVEAQDIVVGNVQEEEELDALESLDIGESKQLLLGFVGQPNVGKSSVINSLFGKKRVSVKKTPGHTKILQTLVLDNETGLCDCPGIVFPRMDVPQEVRIIGNIVPIASIREPYTAVRWLAENCLLAKQMKLKPWSLQEMQHVLESFDTSEILNIAKVNLARSRGSRDLPWSPMSLCARYAMMKGFVRGRRPDCRRAGILILEKASEGKLPWSVLPQSPEQRQELEPYDSSAEDSEVTDESYVSPTEEEEDRMRERTPMERHQLVLKRKMENKLRKGLEQDAVPRNAIDRYDDGQFALSASRTWGSDYGSVGQLSVACFICAIIGINLRGFYKPARHLNQALIHA